MLELGGTGGAQSPLRALTTGAFAVARRRPQHHRKHPHRAPARVPRPRLDRDAAIRSFTQPVKVEALRVYESPKFGHTLERHVNLTPGSDAARLARELEIPASGSFVSEAVAQRCVEAAVAVHSDAIRNWLSMRNSKAPFVRDHDMGEVIGSVLTRSAYNKALREGVTPQANPATGVRIVLRRSDQFPGGFYVRTSYPLPQVTSAADAPRFTVWPLQHYEGEGHALSRHVNVGDADLIVRLQSNSDISAASRFADLATAQSAVEYAIAQKATEIRDWLESERRFPFSSDVTLPMTVGVVLTREAFAAGRTQPVAANRIHFILVRSDDYPGGFYLKTAYPVVPW